MAKAGRTLITVAASGARERGSGAVRPAVEALLAAAVALGCVQAAWDALMPRHASASASPPQGDPGALTAVPIGSPFSLANASLEAVSAAEAALSGLQVAGLRMSTNPTRSGAILTLADGAQRAYLVGDEVAPGVRLVSVGVDGVEVSLAGAQRRLAMSAPATFSYASALMRAGPEDQARAASEARAGGEGVQVQHVSSVGDLSWIAGLFGSVVSIDGGRTVGWRLPAELPASVTSAGLRPGDLVVSINGVRPGEADDALSASIAQGETLTVSVRREIAGQASELTLLVEGRV